MRYTRRDILRLGAASAGTLLFPDLNFLRAASAADPHFFLVMVMNGGADPSYMYDARPLAMTAANKIQNYLGQEPVRWTGSNGVSTLETALVRPLEAFKDRFSVLNGVWMTPSFDGHLQNMNFLFSGNEFGGESFLPHINLTVAGRPSFSLDGIVSTPEILFNVTNHSGVVPLQADTIGPFSKALARVKPIHAVDELGGFIHSRVQALSIGNGRFNAGAGLMKAGLDRLPETHSRLASLKAAISTDSDVDKTAKLIADCYKNLVARSAIYIMPEFFDTHAPEGAKNQPALFQSAIAQVTSILNTLKATPFDGTRSMLDMTTFMITSEMGRTMRQSALPIDGTGTDHNQFGNTVILGGRGIKPGLVVGATDYQSASESLSKVHSVIDPGFDKVVGRPFDFAKLISRNDLPTTLEIRDYLTIGSVINTVYELFGVEKSRYRSLGRNATEAPVLRGLLA